MRSIHGQEIFPLVKATDPLAELRELMQWGLDNGFPATLEEAIKRDEDERDRDI